MYGIFLSESELPSSEVPVAPSPAMGGEDVSAEKAVQVMREEVAAPLYEDQR